MFTVLGSGPSTAGNNNNPERTALFSPSVDFQASYCHLSSPSPALSPGRTFYILCQGQAAQQLTSLAVGHAASLLPASLLEPLVQRKFLLLGSLEADAGVPH